MLDKSAGSTIRARLTEIRQHDRLRREIRYSDGVQGERVLWWEFTGEALPSPLARDDLVPATLIFRAMHEGADLHVEGCVSRDLLDRLDQFQDIWALWRPDLYRKVVITADQEVDVPRRAPSRMKSAICAFSGGVDGTATIWRHHTRQAGRASRRLHAGVLIGGFNIPLGHPAWEVASASAADALSDIGVPFARVTTNWKTDVCVSWGMEFGLGVLGCLRHWDEDVGALLLGSCEDYARLVTPWGSHPLTIQLLASQDSTIAYDAGELTRSAKLALISHWPVGYDTLRVCWEGEITGRNCGKCEKCVRTKLNAVASGVRLPKSLPDPVTAQEVRSIHTLGPGQLALMEEILQVAAENQVEDPILPVVRETIRNAARREKLSQRPPSLLRRAWRKLKRLRRGPAPA